MGIVRYLHIICILILCAACSEQDGTNSWFEANSASNYTEFASYRSVKTSLDSEVLSPYLFKNPELSHHFEFDQEGIKIYPDKESYENDSPEAIIFSNEYERFLKLLMYYPMEQVEAVYNEKGTNPWTDELQVLVPVKRIPFQYGEYPDKPLRGLKVALDPGHIAGNLSTAEIEGKYVKMRPRKELGNEEISFFESELTLATAFLIERQLKGMGADVFISRKLAGRSSEGFTFEEWKDTEFESTLIELLDEEEITEREYRRFLKGVPDKDVFKLFNDADLRSRAERINAYNPDLTLVIHFNVHSENWERKDREGFMGPTPENYCMSFVPGSFMRGELDRVEDRLNFLKLILTDQLERSIRLSHHFMQASVEYTGVPIIDESYALPYLDVTSILTDSPGVYARNLSHTRLIHSPICYGESLCQDNLVEARLLNEKDFNIYNIAAPNRLRAVSNSYVKAVIKYAQEIGK